MGATVEPVAEDPAVRHSVSTFEADKTLEVTDLQNGITGALPYDATVLAQPLTQALRDFPIKEIHTLLATPAAQTKLFGGASDLTAPNTSAGRWAAARMDVLRVAGVAITMILLMLMADPSAPSWPSYSC